MATLEKLDTNRVKLTIEVEKDVFADAMQKAFVKNRQKFNVPGFRKGKAPRKMVENMYGEGVLYEDAFELVYPDAYDKAVIEHDLKPVDRPELEIEKIGSGDGVVFTAIVTTMPEVTLGAYNGIEVVRQAYTVGDDQVEDEIMREREKVARYIDQERPIEEGDRVILDYSGSVDGVKFDGGTAEDQTLEIGSNTFIPGFETQLIGMKAGDEKEINVKFPEDYHAEDLKGKDAVFAVKIKNVQIKELPELDDEFAKDVSEFDTLDELRANKRKELEERAESTAQSVMQNAAIATVVNNATVEIPDVMAEREADYLMQDIMYQLQGSGMTLEQYCGYMGIDPEMMRKSYIDSARERVKAQLVMEAISKAENIDATDEEIADDLKAYADSIDKSVDELKEIFTPEDMMYFKEPVIARKTVDWLMEHAVFVDPPEPEEKKDEPTEEENKPAEEAETANAEEGTK